MRKQDSEKIVDDMRHVLAALSYRERLIIELRYGLCGDGYSYTLEEVSHIFKVTRERIRQIEAKAVRKLNAMYKAGKLPASIIELASGGE